MLIVTKAIMRKHLFNIDLFIETLFDVFRF